MVSCTSVTVQDSKGVTQSSMLGPLRILLDSDRNVTVVSSEGFGLIPSIHGFALGYAKETIFVMSDHNSCKALIVFNSKDAVEQFDKFLEKSKLNLNNICLLRPPGEI